MSGGEPEPEPEAVLVFRDFVIDGETYRIVDGRVLVGFKNPPEPPQMDPNYYDVERPDNDPVMMALCPIVEEIPEVAAFIQAEGLTVYCDWPPAKAIAVILPEGTTVEDAVSNWPTEYPDLIEAVEPDYAVYPHSDWPSGPPSDDAWTSYWNLREDQDHDINIQQAWRSGYLGYPSEVVAMIDTGVQRSHPDLALLATPYGFNVKHTLVSTRCTLGGGGPMPYVYEKNAAMARVAGHGTCTTGIVCARINNGDGIPDNGNDTCGISYGNRYLPVAMDLYWDWQYGPTFTASTCCNAYAVALIVKRVIWNYIGSDTWPFYNIEVVNCSFGGSEWLDYVASRILRWLTPYAVVVASAGNEGRHDFYRVYPAACIDVMCIAAHNQTDLIPFYNYPAWTALIAPTWVPTTDMPGTNYLGHPLGYNPSLESYKIDEFQGTSASAPHVSAVAALMASAHRDWTPAQIRS